MSEGSKTVLRLMRNDVKRMGNDQFLAFLDCVTELASPHRPVCVLSWSITQVNKITNLCKQTKTEKQNRTDCLH